MMFQITIDTDNAAFKDPQECADNLEAEANEIARILDRIAGRLRNEQEAPARLMNINGNKVGNCIWTGRND